MIRNLNLTAVIARECDEFCVRRRSSGVLMTGTPHASTDRGEESCICTVHVCLSAETVAARPESTGCWARQAGQKLRATAALMLGLIAGVPSGFAQQAAATTPQTKQASNLPARPDARFDRTLEPSHFGSAISPSPRADLLGNPINMYQAHAAYPRPVLSIPCALPTW